MNCPVAALRTVVDLATLLPRRVLVHGVKTAVSRVVTLPEVTSVPPGAVVDLPGRGRCFVVDAPGPTPDAPVVVLLHGLCSTAYLSWFTALRPLAEHYRVVMLDLRSHGRGLRGGTSVPSQVADCADDVVAVLDHLGIDRAVLAGYSLGGAVAQETWHRHPARVSGLVLCSTAACWTVGAGERFFFPALRVAMTPLGPVARARIERRGSGLPDVPSFDTTNLTAWGLTELRSTSVWATPYVLAGLGTFDSRPWLADVDVPTAVVVTEKDGAVPAARQRALAEAIPDATAFSAPGGHASLFVDHARWVPIFLEAVACVVERATGDTRLVG